MKDVWILHKQKGEDNGEAKSAGLTRMEMPSSSNSVATCRRHQEQQRYQFTNTGQGKLVVYDKLEAKTKARWAGAGHYRGCWPVFALNHCTLGTDSSRYEARMLNEPVVVHNAALQERRL